MAESDYNSGPSRDNFIHHPDGWIQPRGSNMLFRIVNPREAINRLCEPSQRVRDSFRRATENYGKGESGYDPTSS